MVDTRDFSLQVRLCYFLRENGRISAEVEGFTGMRNEVTKGAHILGMGHFHRLGLNRTIRLQAQAGSGKNWLKFPAAPGGAPRYPEDEQP